MLNLLLLKRLIVGSVEAVQSVDLVSTIKAVDCEYSLFCVSVGSPQCFNHYVEGVEFIVEAVDCCKLLCTLESSSFVEAVESVVVKAVDCCRLLCALVY